MTKKQVKQLKDKPLLDLIDYFELCNRSEGKSQRTISFYTQNLMHFYRYLKSRHMSESIGQIDIKLLRQFILHLQSRRRFQDHPHTPTQSELLSAYTIHGYVRTLKAFFSWLVREEFIKDNLTQKLKPPIVPKKIISTLSDEEIKSIIKTFNSTSLCEMRDQTIFMILLDTGLRTGEIINIKISDISINEGLVKVMGKGSKERIVPMGNNAQKALHKYLFRYRPEPVLHGIDNVFLAIDGNPLTENSIKLIFSRMARRSGVNRLHAHLCRHTFATRFLVNGGDIFSLQQILGHSTLEMVRHYANLASNHIVSQHQKFSPLDHLNLGKL
jgi:integrase/recombinase XerC/integrase/recombinase XerD